MKQQLITHKSFNGSGKIYLLDENKKHHIQDWESFEIGQKIGLWGEIGEVKDIEVDKNIIEGIPFKLSSGFKFQANPLDKMKCTQKFGIWPEFYRKFKMKGHNGVDFCTKYEDSHDGKRPVYAVLDGSVERVINTEGVSGYGKYVVLLHDGGRETLYAHLDSIKVVNGQYVKAGEQIGITDNTGTGTAAHLHFGFRPSKSEVDLQNGYFGFVDCIDYFLGEIKF